MFRAQRPRPRSSRGDHRSRSRNGGRGSPAPGPEVRAAGSGGLRAADGARGGGRCASLSRRGARLRGGAPELVRPEGGRDPHRRGVRGEEEADPRDLTFRVEPSRAERQAARRSGPKTSSRTSSPCAAASPTRDRKSRNRWLGGSSSAVNTVGRPERSPRPTCAARATSALPASCSESPSPWITPPSTSRQRPPTSVSVSSGSHSIQTVLPRSGDPKPGSSASA